MGNIHTRVLTQRRACEKENKQIITYPPPKINAGPKLSRNYTAKTCRAKHSTSSHLGRIITRRTKEMRDWTRKIPSRSLFPPSLPIIHFYPYPLPLSLSPLPHPFLFQFYFPLFSSLSSRLPLLRFSPLCLLRNSFFPSCTYSFCHSIPFLLLFLSFQSTFFHHFLCYCNYLTPLFSLSHHFSSLFHPVHPFPSFVPLFLSLPLYL